MAAGRRLTMGAGAGGNTIAARLAQQASAALPSGAFAGSKPAALKGRAGGGTSSFGPRVSFDDDGDADISVYDDESGARTDGGQYDRDTSGPTVAKKRRLMALQDSGPASDSASQARLTDGDQRLALQDRPSASSSSSSAAAAQTKRYRDVCSDGRPPPEGFHVAIAVERSFAQFVARYGRLAVPADWVPVHIPDKAEMDELKKLLSSAASNIDNSGAKTSAAISSSAMPAQPPQRPAGDSSGSSSSSRFGPQLPPTSTAAFLPKPPPSSSTSSIAAPAVHMHSIGLTSAPVSDKFVTAGHMGPAEAAAVRPGLRPGAQALPPKQEEAPSSAAPYDPSALPAPLFTLSSSSSGSANTSSSSSSSSSFSASGAGLTSCQQLVLGKSNRSESQWVPAKLLLKRMNVPDPLTKQARADYEEAQAALAAAAAAASSSTGAGSQSSSSQAASVGAGHQPHSLWQGGAGSASTPSGYAGATSVPQGRPLQSTSLLAPLSIARPPAALLSQIFNG